MESAQANRPRVTALALPTFGGASLALLFWWRSLTPTLNPRSWQVQAVGDTGRFIADVPGNDEEP